MWTLKKKINLHWRTFFNVFLEKEREREASIGCLSHIHPEKELNPQPRHVPWPGSSLLHFGYGITLQPAEPHRPESENFLIHLHFFFYSLHLTTASFHEVSLKWVAFFFAKLSGSIFALDLVLKKLVFLHLFAFSWHLNFLPLVYSLPSAFKHNAFFHISHHQK